MRKAQISLEKILLIIVIVASAILVLYFLYKSTYTNLSNIGVKSYLEYISFGNIYANKESVFLLLANKTNIGNNIIINEKITFLNGTSNTINIPFMLNMISPSQNGYLYYLTTTDFPQISNSSQSIKVSNINIFNNNSVIESTNTSTNYTSYYYTQSSLSTLPLYHLNMTSSILNGGVLNPDNGYYYAGSKVAISEKSNPGFSFNGWIGSGKGNYTGPNQASIITMNSNITESAQFVKLVKMYVNSTYNGINVYVNGVLNTTTNGIVYFIPGVKYTLSFPMYVSVSNGVRYMFENMQDSCGIPISTNSNSTSFIPTYANYNCKFTANYVEQFYLTMLSSNTLMGTVNPSGGWYDEGSIVEISANPSSDCVFVNWTGSGINSYTGTLNQTNIIMNSPITEEAYFKKILYYYLPITITNNQPIATPLPFQQLIIINSSMYKNYEASGLTNIAFYNSSGVQLDSWLENGNSNTSTSSVYWVKLNNKIQANSNTVIYMRFYQPLSNIQFNSNNDGEAPQLLCNNYSSTSICPMYAEYDDGKNVFNFYDNFKGTILSGGWNISSNGYPYTTMPYILVYHAVNSYIPQVFDAYGGNQNFGIGNGDNVYIPSSSSGEFPILTPSFNVGSRCNDGLYYNYNALINPSYYCLSIRSVGYETGEASIYILVGNSQYDMTTVKQNDMNNNSIYYIFIVVGTDVSYSNNPVNAGYIVDNGLDLYIDYPGAPGMPSDYDQWVRTRSYPPNGIMPSVNFGKIQAYYI